MARYRVPFRADREVLYEDRLWEEDPVERIEEELMQIRCSSELIQDALLDILGEAYTPLSKQHE